MRAAPDADDAASVLSRVLATGQSKISFTNAQFTLFQRCWDNFSYREIAEEMGYDHDYVKQIGAQIWQLLSQITGEKVTKSNLRVVLLRHAERSALVEPPSVYCDWGDATDVFTFFDRASELATLKQWIQTESSVVQQRQRCRLVALLGMGGMGKTALSIKLAEQLMGVSRWQADESLGSLDLAAPALADPDLAPAEPFRRLCWKSLRDAPELANLLAELLESLAPATALPGNLPDRMSALLEVLRQQRCLIVLDNFDALLEASESGQYRNGCEAYGELLRRLGEIPHQSCVIITSRERPPELTALTGAAFAVRVMQLQGLSTAGAEELLRVKGLTGSAEATQSLVQRYSGNPLALKIAATSIQEMFKGDLNRFLRQRHPAFKGIAQLLEQQLSRLSPLEMQVMYWLAVNREPVTLEELQSDLASALAGTDPIALLKALESLSHRCLIEQTAEGFTQQPVVMEYVTANLVDQVVTEIGRYSAENAKAKPVNRQPPSLEPRSAPGFLQQYALIKATARDYIRESQTRMLLEPIAQRLLAQFKNALLLEQIVAQGRRQPQQGYLIGNLINLLRYLEADFTGSDFSHCQIQQAYLADVNLHQVNFSHSALANCIFAETFGGIMSTAFSPDGRLLASADSNGELRVWDLHKQQPILSCKAHLSWIWSIAISSDSRLLASASDDNSVKLWDLETAACVGSLTGHTQAVLAVAFSPDGRLLATGSDDRTIRLWELERLLDQDGNPQSNACQVWQDTHQQRVWGLCFSPDGATLASSSEDCQVKLWRVQNGESLQTLSGHTQWVRAVAFHPSLPILASGSHDQTIHLWQIDRAADSSPHSSLEDSPADHHNNHYNNHYNNQPGNHADPICIQTLRGHTAPITALSFSPDGRHLVSASHDHSLRLWDHESGDCLRWLKGHSNRLWATSFSPDGKLVASGGDDNAVRLWDWQRGSCLKTFQGHTNATLPIALHAEKPVLASSHEDQTVRIWDAKTGQVLKTLRGHSDRVWSVAFAPRLAGKNLLASGSGDSTIRLWNWRSGSCLKILSGHESWVWSVRFHPTAPVLASASYDGTVKLWDIHHGSCLKTLAGHTASVVGLLFSLDGSWLASCGFDHSIRVWDLKTGDCQQLLSGHSNTVWQLALSPDGQMLASCGYDQTVKLWDLASGVCLQTLQGHQAPIVTLAFSADGSRLFSAGFDTTIRCWDLASGSCLQTLKGHQGVISMLLVSDRLISSSFDETIKFWDFETGACTDSWRTPRPYEGLNITATEGITPAQATTLMALGAVRAEPSVLPFLQRLNDSA